MKLRETAKRTLGFLAFMAFMSTAVYGASLFTTWLMWRFQWHVPAPVLNVVDSLLGLLALGFLGSLFARRFGGKNPYDEITAALGRIAVGDFSIRLKEEKNPILRDLAASVNRMAANLGKLETMRQEFISDVSHEIQSPLTSIQGFAAALRDESLSPAERASYLEIIEAESARLSRLSDNLLMLAALESAEGELARTPFRVDKQLRTVILSCEPAWRAKEIQWDLQLAKATLAGHEELLGQVWLNLLQNAIKFSHPGGTIAVELTSQDGALVVRITDHGIGIAPEDQLRIFERFYKADKARDRSMGGSGLGLSLARKIVSLHGGAITVQSELGAGSTFAVSLPLSGAAV